MKVVFVEAPVFTRLLPGYLDDDEYGLLQKLLLANPTQGDVMPGTGGFRKLRWQESAAADQQIWFYTIYDKDEMTDLTPGEKKHLKSTIQAELNARRENRE